MPLGRNGSELKIDARLSTHGAASRSIIELFEEQAERRPTAPAVIYGEVEFTYQELNLHCNRIAHYLRALGVGPEKRVAICMESSPQMLTGMLGVLRAGASFVPLDPTYPSERLSYMMRDSVPQVLLVNRKPPLELVSQNVILVDLSAEQEKIQRESNERLESWIDPRNAAYVIYTSGSTGSPKGVVVEHVGLANLARAQKEVFNIRPGDRILQFASFSFDASVFEIVMALSSGATLVMADREQLMPGPAMIALLESQCITQITVPPSVLRHLPDASLPQLRQIIVAGEAFDAQLLKRWCQGRQVFNAYGPTEATIWASISQCRAEDEQISIGRPISNTRLYVLEDEERALLAESLTGEICIGGQGVARGYSGRADLTAERFVPDPFSSEPGNRIYRTGDLGRRGPDGTVMFLGRKDDQVKLRGHRVELGEIETALGSYPKVLAAVVLAQDASNGDKLLVSYVMTREGQVIGGNELRHHLATRLPAYMVPSQFVMLNAFPLTSNGKIDRRALGASWAPPELPYREPQTATEKALLYACSGVLGLSHASLNSTFMELGGSSLNAARVVAAIRKEFSVEIPLKDLLSARTLHELAGELAQIQPSAPPTHLQIKARPRTQKLPPASFSQERVWFLNQMDDSSLAYNANAKVIFSGELDVKALTRALGQIVERHEMYRTTFTEVEGRLFQKIHQPWQVDLRMVDLVGIAPSDQARRAEEVFSQQSRRTFDLTELPLVRWRLIRLEDKKHELFVTEHHTLHDGWSFNIFMKELTELYRAYVANAIPRISASPLQFADFAQWQREFVESDTAQSQLEYWRKTLVGATPLLSLPYDHPRPVVQAYKGSVEVVEVSEELRQCLSLAARNGHVTQYMLFAAAFQVLLFRYTGQEDFCIGTAIANRRWAETNDLIGMLVDNVTLRARIDCEATIADQIQQVKKIALEAYAHQDIPFDKVVQAVSPQRDLSYNPIFQVMLSFHDSPMECSSLGDLTIKVDPALSNGSAKFDLNVVMIPAQNNDPNSPARLLWEYNTDLFERETVRRLAKHYLRLLEAAALLPDQKLAEIRLLDDAEYSQIVWDWNRTETQCTQQCLHVLFEQQAARTPHAVAVRAEVQELSYKQLNERANQVARYLQRAGAGPETLVGICMERSSDLIVSLLGVLKAGAAYVPLDPALPAGRISYMLEDSRSPIVLTRSALLAGLPQSHTQMLCLDEHWKQIAEEATDNLGNVSRPGNLAYAIYTSGSTGKPKGVMVQHQGLINVLNYFREKLHVTEHDAVLATTTLSFDIAALELYLPLIAGGILVLAGPLQSEIQHLAAKVEQEHISILQGTPTLWNLLAAQTWELSAKDLKILCGGETLEKTTAERLLQISKTVWNVYGPTETTVWSSVFDVRYAPENTVSIGKPIANTQMYVLDDNMQPTPLGVIGDLYIGGMGLARGYVNRPDLTAEKFVPDPFARKETGRLYVTGDLARWKADGNLEFAGRKDYQVKLRGHRIEPGEIEAALLDDDDVEQAVIVAREDGQGDKKLVAYIVTAAEKKVSTTKLHEVLKSRLPEYMVPSHFVILDKLPQTTNGKIDRKALPAPDPTHLMAGQPYVAPQKPVEKAIAQIWASVLHLERVGIYENFFQLGGHSLLGTQVISRVRKAYHVDLPLRSIFAMPTVAQFSEAVEDAVIEKLETLSEEEAEELLGASAQAARESS
ncbi:MAG TPA: amino acid adenylation domain-containing protein [Candidatus Angelobacter sp.]|jgi:amino acid adenylation domain-containing protein